MLRGRTCWEARAVLSQGQGTPRARPASIQQSTRQPLLSSKTHRGGGTTPPPPQLLSSVAYFLGPNSRWQVAGDFHCGCSTWRHGAQLGTCPSAHGQRVSVHFEDMEPITGSWGQGQSCLHGQAWTHGSPWRVPSGPSSWEEKLGVRNQPVQPSGLLTCKQVTAAPSPRGQPDPETPEAESVQESKRLEA